MNNTRIEYRKFLESKTKTISHCGVKAKNINPILFDFQRDRA